MGKCSCETTKVTFDISDPQITEVTVERRCGGDCPIGLKNVVKKTFPARYSMVDLMTMEGGVANHLDWE